ncbi:MAG: hypothetical protein ACI4U5_04795 [Bacilli bacterium]
MFEKSKGSALFQQIFSYKNVSQSYAEVPPTHPFYSFYKKVNSYFEKLKKMYYEEKELQVDNSDTLKGYYFDNMSNKTFIGVHDYCANGIKQLAGQAIYFYSKGYNVFIPFLRGHGKTHTPFTGLGYQEAEDLKAWIDYFIRKNDEVEFVLYGIGIGGSIISILSTFNLPSIKKIILDSPTPSVSSLVNDWVSLVYGEQNGSKKFNLIVSAIKEAYKNVFGNDYQDYDFDKICKDINVPTLLFLEDGDTYYQDLLPLVSCNNNFRIKTIYEASRNEGFYAKENEYIETLNLFID